MNATEQILHRCGYSNEQRVQTGGELAGLTPFPSVAGRVNVELGDKEKNGSSLPFHQASILSKYSKVLFQASWKDSG